MLEVSEKASEVIKKQFSEGGAGPQPIRILLADGRWRGPYFVMAFDEPRENEIGSDVHLMPLLPFYEEHEHPARDRVW